MSHSSKALRRFNHLFSETNIAYHEAAARLGLSYSAMQILYAAYDDGGSCPLQEVCAQTGISKQTINSALRRLEAEGTVCLKRAGGKRKDVCLTQKGAALAERTAGRLMDAENAVYESWPQEDVEQYLALTERYLSSFRNEIKNLRIEEETREKP